MHRHWKSNLQTGETSVLLLPGPTLDLYKEGHLA